MDFKSFKNFALIFLMALGACNLFKITDPSNPKFDPDKFSFCDYNEEEKGELRNVFRVLFPPKTPKDYVDRVLIQAGKGRSGVENQTIVNGLAAKMLTYAEGEKTCDFNLKKPPHHIFYFDQNDRLINIKFNATTDLY